MKSLILSTKWGNGCYSTVAKDTGEWRAGRVCVVVRIDEGERLWRVPLRTVYAAARESFSGSLKRKHFLWTGITGMGVWNVCGGVC